jgi:hypothetical protein
MFKSGSSKKANGVKKGSSKKSGTTKKGNQGSFQKATTALLKKSFGQNVDVQFKSPRNTFDINPNQPTLERRNFF